LKTSSPASPPEPNRADPVKFGSSKQQSRSLQTNRGRAPQCDIELMAQKQVLGLKPVWQIEKIGDKDSEE
jgi:hypothetical protein